MEITLWGEIQQGGPVEYERHRARKEGAMSAAEIELPVETEIDRIERWRAEELERAGYEPLEAAEIAIHHEIDLHFAIELLDRGCPSDTAPRILL